MPNGIKDDILIVSKPQGSLIFYYFQYMKGEPIMITKSNIVEAVAAKAGLKKKDSEAAVNETIAAIAAALANGEKVQITGFGAFEVKERAARTGRNPQSGENIEIPASKRVSFSAGKNLKESVNK